MQAKNTLGRRIAVFVLTVLTTVYCTALPCFAQSAVDANGTVNDIVTGRNNKGPYTLSWADFDARSVSVMLDSRTLKNGADYNLDASKGIIAFDRVVLNGVVVRVSYKTIPGKSTANSGKIDVPANINLIDGKDASLNITGLYTQTDPKKTDASKTIVGMGGSKSWGVSKLTSQFLISQRNDDKSGVQASTWDRSTMKFGTETKLGGLALSGDFMHAGKAFEGSKEFKTDLGKEVANLNALYTSGTYLQATFKFTNNDDTAVNPKGVRNKTIEQSVALTPTAGTKISFTNNSTENANAAGVGKEVAVQAVKIDQAIGTKTNAVASTETVKTTTNGVANEVKTQQVTVNSNAIAGVNVQTGIVNKTTSAEGEQQTVSASAATDPNKKISMVAGVSQTDAKAGRGNAYNYGMRFNDKKMQFQTKFFENIQNGNSVSQRDASLVTAFFMNSKLTTEYVDKTTNGKQDMTINTALDFLPTSTMSVSLLHKILQMDSAAKSMSSDSIRIAQRFGAKTDAMVSMESINLTQSGVNDQIQVNSMGFATTAIIGFNMNANMVEKTSSLNGTETALKAGVTVAPPGLKGLSAQAGIDQKQNANGIESTANAAINMAAVPGVDMQIGVNQNQSATKGDDNKIAATVKIAPVGIPVVVTGTGSQTTSDKAGVQKNIVASVAVVPSKIVSIKANLNTAQNTPNGGVNGKIDTTRSAVLEVKPFSHTMISTGLKQVLKDTDLLTTRDYGAESNPNKYVSLKGGLRDRQLKTGGAALDSKNVQVALNPFSSVKFTGELWENPEDAKTGVAQAFNTTGFGLNWQIGSVGLTTNVTSKDEYMANTQAEEQKIGLEVPLFGSGRLVTDFKRSKLLNTSELVTRTYSMGYKRNLGGAFDLSLSGYYADCQRDRAILSDKTDYGAQANFGIKF